MGQERGDPSTLAGQFPSDLSGGGGGGGGTEELARIQTALSSGTETIPTGVTGRTPKQFWAGYQSNQTSIASNTIFVQDAALPSTGSQQSALRYTPLYQDKSTPEWAIVVENDFSGTKAVELVVREG